MHLKGHQEWPLVFFTILTQLAVGTFVVWVFMSTFLPSSALVRLERQPVILLLTVLVALLLGVLVASFHLGRMVGAVFSLSNWRTSWLSREAFLAAGFGFVVLIAMVLRLFVQGEELLYRLVLYAGVILGLSLVYGISRLYRLRTVPAWNNWGTPASFFTTSLLTGTVVNMMLSLILKVENSFSVGPNEGYLETLFYSLVIILVGLQAMIFIATIMELNHQGGAGAESVRMLWGKLRPVLLWRWLTAGIGVLPLLFGLSSFFILLSCGLMLFSELLGRYLFYAFYQRIGY